MRDFSLDRFLHLVEQYQVTRAHVVPPILLGLSALQPRACSKPGASPDLSSLRVMVSAAAPLDAELERAVETKVGATVKQVVGRLNNTHARRSLTD